MADKARITVTQQSDGSYSASIGPDSITPDSNKDIKLDIDTSGWMFDSQVSAPPEANGWTSIGSGIYVENGSDFSLKNDSNSTKAKINDTGADRSVHPTHRYLVCLTDGTNHINTDPIIIDRDGN
ncbi:hypothetical protein [Sphingomicrobium marinum]|uniref:hypothetical protein n=1 Tax=Sphingomicrobium marinum TaxID=1227950 RepID=UPI00223FA16A|nr:hypothetical protein [Sphingomicrobium marinum]